MKVGNLMQIIDQACSPNIFGKPVYYNVIELKETHLIGRDPLTNTHRYWIPMDADLDDTSAYIDPLDQIDYNFEADFALYREKFNFLTAAEITNSRENLGLTPDEAALILGLTTEKLSDIENDGCLQSFEQETLLRLLTTPDSLRQHVQRYHALIELRAKQADMNVDALFAKLEKINAK